jgi:protein-S-isoprenylcysteine O-methyltransferase Ste14
MYLGLVVISVGAALLFNAPWLLILLIPTIGIVHIVLIVSEEKYLAEEFREAYEQYATKVRRWI